MAIDVEQVKAALNPEEPNYPKAAKALGPDALPHLEKIIGGSDTLLAAKATYLAGIIGGEKSVPAVEKAARSSQATIRIAAAAAAAHLPAEHSDTVLAQLVDDADAGVQKVAVYSAPETMSDRLRARVNVLRKGMKSATSVKTKSRKAKKQR
jgi:hypothetical protein